MIREVDVEGVVIGASYYPLMHDPGDWERDVRLMREHGLTVVRTLELMNSWDRIEPREGVYDFGFVDRFMDILQRHAMQALLGDGAACPPAWLALTHPDSRILSRDGVPHDFQGRWGWACPDHPHYTAAMDRYQTALVERYRGHPALFGWQIHNEVGLPARARWGTGAPDIYCYCTHSRARYRDWLKQKYGSLDALNDAWRWDPTNVVFTTWEDIEPTRSSSERTWPGYWHRANVEIQADDVQVLAEFPGEVRSAAVVQRPFGQGAVLYIGTQADVAAARGVSSLLGDIVGTFLQRHGVDPDVVIEPANASLVLRVHRLKGPDADMVVVVNQTDGAGGYHLRLRTTRRIGPIDELIRGETVAARSEVDGVTWTATWPEDAEAAVFRVRHE